MILDYAAASILVQDSNPKKGKILANCVMGVAILIELFVNRIPDPGPGLCRSALLLLLCFAGSRGTIDIRYHRFTYQSDLTTHPISP